jgi:Bax protein
MKSLQWKSHQFALMLFVLIIGFFIYQLPSTQQISALLNNEVISTSNTPTKQSSTKQLSNSINSSKPEIPIPKSIPETTVKNKPIPVELGKSTRDSTAVPNFSSIKDVKLKKATFFKFMRKNIKTANQKVLKERQLLMRLVQSHSSNQIFTIEEKKQYHSLAKKYRAFKGKQPTKEKLAILKQKINMVPPSLILAQSANESAWGTSRFARKGNNYFGQWCYSKGCGLVPASRNLGSSHEVAKFSSVQKSVEEYIFNINVSRSYKKIRKLREQMIQAKKPVDSIVLATGLEKYSERGKEYVKEIQSMIRYNKLKKFDN